MTGPLRKAFQAFVIGRVQGVGFRYSAVREARSLGLQGMVRNLPDGSVEVVAEGPEDSLERFLRWLRKGPPGSRVTDVQVTDVHYSGQYGDFDVDF